MCVFEVWNLFGGESGSWFSYRFPLPNGPGIVKLPVGQVDLNRFFLFISYLSRSKNFKILEIGQVMILRKGKPCVVMPVTGSGKGFVPDDSKPLSGNIHAGRHASNLALQCISLTFQTHGCSPEETVPGFPTSVTASNYGLVLHSPTAASPWMSFHGSQKGIFK